MTYAVQAYIRAEGQSVWQIILLAASKRRVSKYAERHHMNGGQALRVVEVSLSKEDQEDCCPFAVEVIPGDKEPIRFRYEEEAKAFAERFLNSVVSTRRPKKSEREAPNHGSAA